MKKWVCIWYNTTRELHREIILAETEDEARKIAHSRYNSTNCLLSVVEEDKL